MKKILMLSAVLFSFLSMSAEYVNYFQEGMEWTDNIYNIGLSENGHELQRFQTIGKCYLAPGSGDYSPEQTVLYHVWNNETTALAAIECEGDKVYFRLSGYDGRYLMYDFGLQPGEEKEFFRILNSGDAPCPFYAKCYSREEEEINGGIYQIIRFCDLFLEPGVEAVVPGYWIAGIGCSYGVSNNCPDLMLGDRGTVLINAKLNGEMVYNSGISNVQEVVRKEKGEQKFYLPDGSLAPEGYKGLVISSDGKKILKK